MKSQPSRPMLQAIQLNTKTSGKISGAVRAIAALLLVHLFAILMMAASPRLHQWVHHDAGSADHECAVTLFSHGGSADAPAVPVVFIAFVAVPLLLSVLFRPVWVAHPFLSSHVLEHAPPAFR